MDVLIWNHGKTPAEARSLMQDLLATAGFSDKVVWNGHRFTSSVGWGTILNLVGEIRADTIVLQKCSGAIGGVVLSKCREAFREMFPTGEELPLTENATHKQPAV